MYLPSALSSEQAQEFVRALSRVLGWSYFVCWAVSAYSQPVANYRRKSVTGLAVDYFAVNVLGFYCYCVSAALFLFSATVRGQYARRHPLSPEPTMRWNDFVFAMHSSLTSSCSLSMFWLWGFKRDPTQRVSRYMLAVIVAFISAIAVASLDVLVDGSWEWIDVAYLLQYIKITITIIKFIPQVLLNYERKGTTGWAMENTLLDLAGGFLSFTQLVLDSSLQGDWSGLIGNPIKFFLAQICIFFDFVFIVQHYILYRRSAPAVESRYGTLPPLPRTISRTAVGKRPQSRVEVRRMKPLDVTGRRLSMGEGRRGGWGSRSGEEEVVVDERMALLSQSLGETTVGWGATDI